VGRKETSVARFKASLRALNERVHGDLALPSIRETRPRVQGFAFKFSLTLPLFTADGRPVFSVDHLAELHKFLDIRFGGCTGASYRSGAPFFGEYFPEGIEPVRDHNTQTYVYANPIEPSNRLFEELKEILRHAPLIPQDEILIERTEVYLV
jgi:hypothetical protein